MSKFKPGDKAIIDLSKYREIAGPTDRKAEGRRVRIVEEIPFDRLDDFAKLFGAEFYIIEFDDGLGVPPELAKIRAIGAPATVLVPIEPPREDFIPAATRALFTPKPQPVKA